MSEAASKKFVNLEGGEWHDFRVEMDVDRHERVAIGHGCPTYRYGDSGRKTENGEEIWEVKGVAIGARRAG